MPVSERNFVVNVGGVGMRDENYMTYFFRFLNKNMCTSSVWIAESVSEKS
jgi:hypothetical protein